MTQTIFPTSLFDFDFTTDNATLAARRAEIDAACDKCAVYVRRRTLPAATLAPRTDSRSELMERAAALRKLAARAFEEDRMGAYFRILDSLDAYPDFVAEPTPATYGIPEVKLSYVSDPAAKSRPSISNPVMLCDIFRDSYEAGELAMRECFKVAYLDRRNNVLGIHTTGVGGLDTCPVDVRLIFTGALLAHSSQIAICHNHPSGNLSPSIDDDQLTRKIAEAGKILQIKLLDHIILTEESYYSYMDHGKL